MAVFTSVPVADWLIVATRVNVAVPPGRSETFVATLPAPLAAAQLDPAEAAHVHVADVTEPGRTSATGAATTALGPAFETTIAYVVVVPGTTDATPSVFVIERSAVGTIVSVSVAVLFPGVGSVTPAGTPTVAVFTRVPVADGDRVAASVKVAVPPARSETVDAMSPIPLTAAQLDPAEATHVHVADVIAAGRTSVTGAATTALGPAFVTTIVYVVVVPGTTFTTPSVFVIERSAVGTSVSVSVAVLFPGVGSVTPAGTPIVAVFTRVPVADWETTAARENVAVPPGRRETPAAMLPEPLAVPQLEPAEAAHVHVADAIAAGRTSETGAFTTALGPAFEATIT